MSSRQLKVRGLILACLLTHGMSNAIAQGRSDNDREAVVAAQRARQAEQALREQRSTQAGIRTIDCPTKEGGKTGCDSRYGCAPLKQGGGCSTVQGSKPPSEDEESQFHSDMVANANAVGRISIKVFDKWWELVNKKPGATYDSPVSTGYGSIDGALAAARDLAGHMIAAPTDFGDNLNGLSASFIHGSQAEVAQKMVQYGFIESKDDYVPNQMANNIAVQAVGMAITAIGAKVVGNKSMSVPVTGVKAINFFKSLAPKVGGFAALLTTAQVYESKGRETYADIAQTYIENVMAQLEAVVIFGLTKTNSKRLSKALNVLADSGDTAGDITEQLNTWRDEIPDDVRVNGDRLLALTEEVSKELKLRDDYETQISKAEKYIADNPDEAYKYKQALSKAKNGKQRLDERIEQLRQERDNLNADLAHIENQKWAALIYYITIKLDLLSGGGTGA